MHFGKLILAVVLASTLIGTTPIQAQSNSDLSVLMIGVGNPSPRMDRFGPGTLIKAGETMLMFDAGRGGVQRLAQAGENFGDIDALFLTHLHSDHVVGIPDLLLTGWILRDRVRKFVVYGPTGTKSMMDHIYQAFAADIDIRIRDNNADPEGSKVDAHDIQPGLVYDENGVQVYAITVDHGELVKPAMGFRIDYGEHSVVISGDTKFYPPLGEAAKGADLFLHAVADLKPELLETWDGWARIIAHHTQPADVGRIFDIAQPDTAVLYHLGYLGNKQVPAPTEEEVVDGVRSTYDGTLVVGQDLMRFNISDEGVEVINPEE